jgi:cardiolipin synthase A/B
MIGIDTYSELLALIGCVFVVWLLVVTLFAPHIPYTLHARLDCTAKDFIDSLNHVTLSSIHHDSRFDVLTNGTQFYPPMLSAIKAAKQSINMECYIFRPDGTGRAFMTAIMERARAGVTVKLVVDAVGSFRFGLSAVREMREAGCKVELYQRFKWYRLSRLNNRTHRELLIVDGTVAFVGGAGIGDQWARGLRGKAPWRDTMARVTGPVVSSIQGVFAENWVECVGEILCGPEYFPPLTKTGDTSTIVVKSSPADRATACRVVFQTLIESAGKHIRINTPYFLPDKSLRQAFIATAKRGVRIDIIVPGSHTDQRWVRLVSRRKYNELLREGIRIYEYRVSMTHAKVLNVDDLWVMLGTTNFDNRSFEHNDEVNVAIRDEHVSACLTKDFEQDLKCCEEVTLDTWRQRPLFEKIVEPFAWILERQQ